MKWPADNQDALIRFYGTPGPEVERQLVPVVPPFKMYYEGQPVKSIRFHKKAAPALLAALTEIWKFYGENQTKIDKLGISKYAGAYNPRFIRGSTTKWSNHAYGAAIDLNAEDNGFGAGKGNIPKPVVDAFKRQGARWGGDYKGRTDPMHFEFCDAGAVKPLTAFDPPPVDSDNEEPEPTAVVPVAASPDAQNKQVQDSAEADTETRGSWISRKWRAITGWTSGIGGAGFLGWLTDPWVVVALVGGVIVIVILFVLFMGPGDVRAWIRKQVA